MLSLCTSLYNAPLVEQEVGFVQSDYSLIFSIGWCYLQVAPTDYLMVFKMEKYDYPKHNNHYHDNLL